MSPDRHQVAVSKPPTNAEAANTELAKGQQETASEVQAFTSQDQEDADRAGRDHLPEQEIDD
jgi:hypothetical protein